VVNSVVMNHVTIGDGCSIQGSVICSNAQLQERAVLKDCQVLSPSPVPLSLFSLSQVHTVHNFMCILCCHLAMSSFQVGAGFVVTAGSEHKGESLARK
jgi:translation initiation factor eIF-2B subunit gamma